MLEMEEGGEGGHEGGGGGAQEKNIWVKKRDK